MKTVKDRIEAKKSSLKSVSGKSVITKNGKHSLKRSNKFHQSIDYSNKDLSQIFANIKRRYSTKHEALSPKVWNNRPDAKSFQDRFDRLYQNTLLSEQNDFPQQISFRADHCYFYYCMFKLEKVYQPSPSFLCNQARFSIENRSQ